LQTFFLKFPFSSLFFAPAAKGTDVFPLYRVLAALQIPFFYTIYFFFPWGLLLMEYMSATSFWSQASEDTPSRRLFFPLLGFLSFFFFGVRRNGYSTASCSFSGTNHQDELFFFSFSFPKGLFLFHLAI